MMTQTHLLVAATVFAKPKSLAFNSAVITGALIPDAALYGLFAYERLQGTSPEVIFNQLYWSPEWQAMLAPGNSFIVFGLVAFLAFAAFRNHRQWLSWSGAILAAAIAALMHLALDFPFHNDDAYAHFWPLTEWKFISPVSYWDHRHYGYFIQPVEIALGVLCLFLLLRRFPSRAVKTVLALTLIAYIAVPLSFAFLPDQALSGG